MTYIKYVYNYLWAIMENKSFCAIPFIGLMVDSTQYMGYCCMAPEGRITVGDKVAMAGVDSIAAAWNSTTMQNLRRDMIDGKSIKECSNCYYRESLGKKSNRQHSIDEWVWRLGKKDFDNRIQTIIDNNFIAEDTPVYLDLRLGNLCNLKCKMCNPFNSSQIAKEHFELFDTDANYNNFWVNRVGKNPLYLKEENLWYESDFLWDEVIAMIPKLKKVYMTGGEPTMVEGNFKFMQACLDLGRANDINIFFNINCTNLNNRFINLISQFKNVSINASIDGVGETNDYIRYPSKWKHVDINFRKLAAIKDLDLKLSPTLTVFNALECDKIIHYVDQVAKEFNRIIPIDYLFNSSLDIWDATLLSNSVRAPVADRLEELSLCNDIANNTFTKNSIAALISIMKSPRNKNYKSSIKDLFQLSGSQDSYRNQFLKQVLPEVYQDLINAE